MKAIDSNNKRLDASLPLAETSNAENLAILTSSANELLKASNQDLASKTIKLEEKGVLNKLEITNGGADSSPSNSKSDVKADLQTGSPKKIAFLDTTAIDTPVQSAREAVEAATKVTGEVLPVEAAPLLRVPAAGPIGVGLSVGLDVKDMLDLNTQKIEAQNRTFDTTFGPEQKLFEQQINHQLQLNHISKAIKSTINDANKHETEYVNKDLPILKNEIIKTNQLLQDGHLTRDDLTPQELKDLGKLENRRVEINKVAAKTTLDGAAAVQDNAIHKSYPHSVQKADAALRADLQYERDVNQLDSMAKTMAADERIVRQGIESHLVNQIGISNERSNQHINSFEQTKLPLEESMTRLSAIDSRTDSENAVPFDLQRRSTELRYALQHLDSLAGKVDRERLSSGQADQRYNDVKTDLNLGKAFAASKQLEGDSNKLDYTSKNLARDASKLVEQVNTHLQPQASGIVEQPPKPESPYKNDASVPKIPHRQDTNHVEVGPNAPAIPHEIRERKEPTAPPKVVPEFGTVGPDLTPIPPLVPKLDEGLDSHKRPAEITIPKFVFEPSKQPDIKTFTGVTEFPLKFADPKINPLDIQYSLPGQRQHEFGNPLDGQVDPQAQGDKYEKKANTADSSSVEPLRSEESKNHQATDEPAWMTKFKSGLKLETLAAATDKAESSINRASTDFTGLATPRVVREDIMREQSLMSRDPSREKAVLAIMVDKFKEVNDLFDHNAGDIVLKTLAQSVLKDDRSSVLVGHLRGDTFCEVAPISDLEGIQAKLLLARVSFKRVSYKDGTAATVIEVSGRNGQTTSVNKDGTPVKTTDARQILESETLYQTRLVTGTAKITQEKSPEQIVGEAIKDLRRDIPSYEYRPQDLSNFDRLEVDKVGNEPNLIEVMRHIHENAEKHAVIDDQTQLPNKLGFHEAAVRAFSGADRKGEAISYVKTDAGGLGTLNVVADKSVGDQYLLMWSNEISKFVRAGDILGRTGGDEFDAVLHSDDASSLVGRLTNKRIYASPPSPDAVSGSEQSQWQLHMVDSSQSPKPGDIILRLFAEASTREPNEFKNPDYNAEIDSIDRITDAKVNEAKENALKAGLRAPRGSVVCAVRETAADGQEHIVLKTMTAEEYKAEFVPKR